MRRLVLMAALAMVLFPPVGIRAQAAKPQTDSTAERVLTGKISLSELRDSTVTWFGDNYKDYRVNAAFLDSLKESLDRISLRVFMGTWCSDSQLQMPRLIKILDLIKFPEDRLEIYGLDKDKKCPGFDLKALGINLLPTIIVLRDDTELGRINESPEESLEEDLLRILH